MLFVEMKKGCEILHVKAEGWQYVQWNRGKMQMNMHSLALSFDAGARVRIGQDHYQYRNGAWCAVAAR